MGTKARWKQLGPGEKMVVPSFVSWAGGDFMVGMRVLCGDRFGVHFIDDPFDGFVYVLDSGSDGSEWGFFTCVRFPAELVGIARAEEVHRILADWEEEHPDGCCLHMVLEDFSFGPGHVQICLDHARLRGHRSCAEMAQAFIGLDHEQMHVATGLPLDEECSICAVKEVSAREAATM